ncbi:MAG: hypothetical protein AAF559_00905 [Pseudomonadota bacterium]
MDKTTPLGPRAKAALLAPVAGAIFASLAWALGLASSTKATVVAALFWLPWHGANAMLLLQKRLEDRDVMRAWSRYFGLGLLVTYSALAIIWFESVEN